MTDRKVTAIKNRTYEVSQEIEQCAMEVILKKNLSIVPARVKFLKTSPYIEKNIAARCTRANNFVMLFGEVEFVIECSGDLWDSLSLELREILLYHELLHIVCTQNEKSGEWKFSLRQHDVNEFSEIIQEYGIDWLSDVKNIFISSGGFEPDEITTLTL